MLCAPLLTPIAQPREVELTDFDVGAVGCFLEYLYTGEYFPKKLPGQRVLESDPTVPSVDDSGDQLLKHARVYTLAEKFGVPGLKTLASSKIHCVNSTAKGEIAYARYVYAYTSDDDTVIRAPVASFWATRSHTLRAEAESEFKSLCLEHPQFGYDVLSMSCPLQRSQRGTNNIQLVSWTTSSSESALIKCTPLQAATASVLVIAAGLARFNMGRPYQLGLGTKVLDGLAIGVPTFFSFSGEELFCWANTGNRYIARWDGLWWHCSKTVY